MRNMGPLLIILGGGGILYYLYSKGCFSGGAACPFHFPSSTPAPSPTPTQTGTGTGTSSGTGTGTGTSTSGGTPIINLATIAQRVQASAGAVPPSGLTSDGWNFSLNSVYPAAAGVDDPSVIFPGIDRTQPMPWSVYWQTMAPVLSAHFGLSGLRGLSGWYA